MTLLFIFGIVWWLAVLLANLLPIFRAIQSITEPAMRRDLTLANAVSPADLGERLDDLIGIHHAIWWSKVCLHTISGTVTVGSVVVAILVLHTTKGEPEFLPIFWPILLGWLGAMACSEFAIAGLYLAGVRACRQGRSVSAKVLPLSILASAGFVISVVVISFFGIVLTVTFTRWSGWLHFAIILVVTMIGTGVYQMIADGGPSRWSRRKFVEVYPWSEE